MNDVATSGDPLPEGRPARPLGASDVAGTLSDLERKLRALEIELSAVRRTPEPQEPESAVPAVRLIDEHLEMDEPADQQGPAEPRPAAPIRAPRPADEVAVGAFARAPAVPPLPPTAAPPAGAQRLIGEVRERMAGVAEQLEELMRLRRELELRAHELEHGIPPASAPSPWPSRSPSPSPTEPAPTHEAALFEGHVEVDVGPFTDTEALARFERTLSCLAGVSGARVRAYGASRALIDLQLSAPSALLAELHRAFGRSVAVLAAEPGRVSLVLDAPQGPA